jgi:ribosomal protein L32
MSIKVVPKATCDPENCSESRLWIYTGQNRQIGAKESPSRNLMRLSEQLLTLASVSQEAEKLNIYFFFNNEAKIKNHLCMYRKYWFSKKLHLMAQSLKALHKSFTFTKMLRNRKSFLKITWYFVFLDAFQNGERWTCGTNKIYPTNKKIKNNYFYYVCILSM